MSWAGLANNQCVSCNNLQNAVNNNVFVQKNIIPSSNKEITKTEAENYVYINTVSKASNQLVVKGNLVSSSPTVYTYTLYAYSDDGIPNYIGFSSIANACTLSPSYLTYTVYSLDSPLVVGSKLWTNSGCSIPISNVSGGYYFKINSQIFQLNDGAYPYNNNVTSTTTCAETLNWSWTNNNVVESPPFGGGYISINVNGGNVVSQSDFGSSIVTYTGSLSVNIGDTISVTVYSYANDTYGTESTLIIENPNGTTIFNSSDTNPSPGSASSISYSWTATSGGITINGYSNSY